MGGVPSKPDASKKMQVFGAGYSRTGTLSMSIALEKLLNGPVIHGGSHAISGTDSYVKKWSLACQAHDAGDKETTLKLLKEVTTGYVGCTDLPGIMFTPEFNELYPDAKWILVTRDPKKWWDSMGHLTDNAEPWFVKYVVVIAPTWRWLPPIFRKWRVDATKLCGRPELGPDLLEAYNKMVIDTVPKDQLLIMSMKDGWEPLCKFLGKPVPDEPFPRVNDAEATERVAIKVFGQLLLMWTGVFTVIGGGLYIGWRMSH